ncbi:Proteinase inhibitor I3, Kunitz legume [Sesbania bispinosa]|nr:Proteinase inhibitor I3, Kunitz legume [Sesbania bispinosa]
MKPALLLTLSLLFYAFTTYLPLAFSQEEIEQVVDINGNPIFPGSRFYIVGLPVHFKVPGISSGPRMIYTNVTGLNIVFEEKPECAESSNWVVVSERGKIFTQQWVGIGGVGDHPGKNIIDGKFYIQRYSASAYKFVFCSTTGHVCSDIARFFGKNRRLILTNDDLFPVVFVDADAVDESSI